MNKAIAGVVASLFLAACAPQQIRQDMSAFTAAAPRSILVVPIANKSLDVDAPNYVLSTLSVPVAERGYYVFPVNTTKFVLEQEGLYEGDRIHQEPPAALAKLFDADAVLYVTIHRWDAQYIILSTTVTVEFEYKMFAKDGTPIWAERRRMQYQPQNNNSGHPLATLIVAVVNAAVARAAPNYLPLTRQANNIAFVTGPNALPNGPYRVVEKQQGTN